MKKIVVTKNKKLDVTFVSSDNVERDFTKDLLEYFLKEILFKHTLYIYISFKHTSESISYALTEIDVDNIYGYDIPFSELDNQDIQYCSISSIATITSAMEWIKLNVTSYVHLFGNVEICLEEPQVCRDFISIELLSEHIKNICDNKANLAIGCKHGFS